MDRWVESMTKKTVAELDAEFQDFRQTVGNVQVASGTCWNHAQMGAILEKYARHGEMLKSEIRVDHTPSHNGYHYVIWHLPLLNPESRQNDEYVIAGMSGHDFTPTRD